MDPLSTTLPPGDVFAGLASGRIEDRDSATRMAIAMGSAVARKLLLWDEAPASNRARRLWAYTGIHLRRAEEAIRQPRNFALDHAGTLASVLDALAARHGVLVARDLPDEAQRAVELALPSTTLLGALDDACIQAGCRGGQRARGELAATVGPEPRYPASYRGPSRVRATEVRSVRATDFQAATASTQVRLRADWEWPVTPLSSVLIELADGRSFEATPVGTVVNVGIVAELVVEVPTAPAIEVSGRISALFDGAFTEVRMPVPGSIEVHGLTATASIQADGVQLLLETTDAIRTRGDIAGLGVSPMILAIADDGEEGVPQVHRVRTAGAPGHERWGIRNRDGFSTVVELRLRIAAPPTRATVPFALPPIALP